MTPDQYRLEGFCLGIKAAANEWKYVKVEGRIAIAALFAYEARIRAIDPTKVLAKVEDDRCVKCGEPRSNHPYRHPFVGMGNDPSTTHPFPDYVVRLVEAANQARMAFAGYVPAQTAINKLDEALAAMETNHDRT